MLSVWMAMVSTLGAFPAPVEGAGLTPPPLVQAEEVPTRAESVPHFALIFDAGAPDGAGASLAIRPWPWLRVFGGVITDGVSPGYRGGISLLPFHFGITPVFTLEGGHLSDGNANPLVGTLKGDPNYDNAALQHLGYDFANAQLGVELGPPDRWAFFARAGVSYVRASTGLEQGVHDMVSQATGGWVSVEMHALWMPSVKLGMTLYLF